ncbi:MAG: rane protein of unknown function [Acidimicrobiaceae bacterium]|nr:rane protein of unknown function [Acidimicrobiaceae bacterium]
MADRTIKAVITGSSAGAVKAFEETALAADKAGAAAGDKIEAAGGRVSGVFGKLGGIASNLGLPFGEAFGKIGEGFSELETKGQKFSSAMAGIGKVSLLAGAAGAAAFGVEAVKAGNALEDSQVQLTASIKASGSSFDQWQPKIAATQQKMEALGFSNADVNTALSKSDISTQNVGQSLSVMTLAADLARAKHIDLSTAIDSVDKAMTGNLRPLKQLSIDLPIASSSAYKLQQANQALQKAQTNVTYVLQKYPDAANAASKGHIQYEKATDAVTRAQQRLAGQQQASGDIMAALSSRLAGQASSAADTFSGRIEVLKTKTEDITAKIGVALIPILEKLASTVAGVIGWFEQHRAITEVLAGVIGGVLVVAIGFYVGSMVAAAVSTVAAVGSMFAALGSLAATYISIFASSAAGWVASGAEAVASGALQVGVWVATAAAAAAAFVAENVAMLGIGVAIAALVAGIVWMGLHWGEVWDAIKTAADDAWQFLDLHVVQPLMAVPEFVKTHWELLLAILTGPIGLAVLFIKDHIDTIVQFFTDLPGRIVSTLGDLAGTIFAGISDVGSWLGTHVWTPISNFFTSIPGKIKSAAAGMWDGLYDAFKDAINFVIQAWDTFVGHFDVNVGPIHIHWADALKIPMLADGGIVTSPTLAMIGEAGPEAVVPLGRGSGGGGGAGGGDTYDFSGMTVIANDPQSLVNQLKVYIQRNGSLASAGIR